MSKKMFEIRIDVTSQTWETCYTYVEAETSEEAEEVILALEELSDAMPPFSGDEQELKLLIQYLMGGGKQ